MSRALFCAWWVASVAACGSLPLEVDAPDAGVVLPGGRFHPLDWAVPENHGLAAKLQQLDCRTCHGADLALGGSASVGCDGCHQVGWRQNCTYCHGGVDNALGSPPRDLRGEANRGATSFPAHTVHVSDTATHAAFDCVQCHVKPTDVLSARHMFDDTPDGVVELVFSGGLSRAGTWQGNNCNNNYCHGNGRSPTGRVAANAAPMTCTSCHPTTGLRSGRHEKHFQEGIPCSECHGDTVDTSGTRIVQPSLHVNGRIEVRLSTSGMSIASGRCTGTCHGERHSGEGW